MFIKFINISETFLLNNPEEVKEEENVLFNHSLAYCLKEIDFLKLIFVEKHVFLLK